MVYVGAVHFAARVAWFTESVGWVGNIYFIQLHWTLEHLVVEIWVVGIFVSND